MKTAWKHIRRSPYQALTAVSIMTLTFFVATMLVVLGYATTSLLKYFETRPQLIAYLKKDASSEETAALQTKLASDVRVEGVKIVSKEEALEIYREATANNPLLAEFVSPKVFPASVEFSVKDLSFVQQLVEEVGQDPTVEEIAFTASLGDSQNLSQVIERLVRFSNYIRVGGGAFVGFLIATSLLVLLVIISMRISARREEIEILQLIGATPGFIRTPFLIEGMLYGVVGAFTGWLLALLLTLYISPSLINFFKDIPFLPTDIMALLGLFGVVIAGEVVLAALLGTVGSLFAIKRYLKI